MENIDDRIKKAEVIFKKHGGVLRTMEAIKLGIHPRILYQMRDMKIIEQLSRGLYRLSDLPPLSNQDLVTVALKIPGGVICLVSALAYHEITTQIPHQVYVALDRGAEPPRLEHPPISIYWFKGDAYREGMQTHTIDKITVRIYNPEKTIADCVKYRNKIGIDVVLEALKMWWTRKDHDVNQLMYYARVCRVEKVIRPYIEALL
ncbi:type IV toxin-antitoxin system AbiEi family antitoxin domain-containing protein [Planctomycetota bacterium]